MLFGYAGKTKVLTARVAYLAQHYKLSPEDMVYVRREVEERGSSRCSSSRVVTFTNKAANEMKSRLKLLVGSAVVERLMMGTFHSYGRLAPRS